MPDPEIVTLREAVQARPAMWFGDHPTADWPVVIALWTARTLFEYTTGDLAKVELTLHGDGALSATCHGTDRFPPEEEIRRRMWWMELARSTAITLTGAQDHINVRIEIEPELIGVGPGAWWHQGLDRLRRISAVPHFQLAAGHCIVATDEATGASAMLEA